MALRQVYIPIYKADRRKLDDLLKFLYLISSDKFYWISDTIRHLYNILKNILKTQINATKTFDSN